MWCILHLIFILPICYVTVPMFQHYIISHIILYRYSYLYEDVLLSDKTFMLLLSYSNLLIFLRVLYLLIFVRFLWCFNYQSTICLIEGIISRSNISWSQSITVSPILCRANFKHFY